MIGAIVLAAGESRRMGTQKLLLPFGGKTVIAHIFEQLRESRVGEIIVVVGHEGERIEEELRGHDVGIVNNPDYVAGGMLSSARRGLRALPHKCDGVMVVLGDQPAISRGLIDRLIEFFGAASTGIVVPCYQGKRGHPMIFAARFREEVLNGFDEEGLRGLLRAHPEDVAEMDVTTDAVLADMDYPEDYRRELERFARNLNDTNK